MQKCFFSVDMSFLICNIKNNLHAVYCMQVYLTKSQNQPNYDKKWLLICKIWYINRKMYFKKSIKQISFPAGDTSLYKRLDWENMGTFFLPPHFLQFPTVPIPLKSYSLIFSRRSEHNRTNHLKDITHRSTGHPFRNLPLFIHPSCCLVHLSYFFCHIVFIHLYTLFLILSVMF